MGQNLIKYIFLLLLVACSSSNDKTLAELLKNHYANLEINDFENKQQTINSLLKISSNKIEDISNELNKLNDGHVYIVKSNEVVFNFHTDLEFIPGTSFISSCQQSCRPNLLGKFKILKVDGKDLSTYIKENGLNVFASSEWGREHRVIQSLQHARTPIQHLLLVKGIKGKNQSVALQDMRSIVENESCVFGKRIDEKHFYLSIHSFWCDENGRLKEEKDILKKFSSDWNNQIKKINDTDKIILDLRENNGGGDHEVMYVLNTFIDHIIPMYKYQYLKSNIESKREWITNLFSKSNSKWGLVESDYSQSKYKPIKSLFKNEITTLISSGCFSSCEGLAGMLKLSKRSKLVGSQTHGGAGDPKLFKIKDSDYYINLPTMKVWLSNGDVIEGKGITPDIERKDNFVKESDEILESVI